MTLRLCFVSILVFIALSAIAQDKIYETDGNVIASKVKSVGRSTVIYKRYDNEDGPEYTILKREIIKIIYQNGTVDYFTEEKAGKNHSGETHNNKDINRLGANILTVIPAAFTADVINNSMNDPGLGICYERLLDPNGHISVILPVMINFVQNNDFNSIIFNANYNYSGYGSAVSPITGTYTSWLFMPGVKFYPAGSNNKFRYSIGASLFALFGNEPYAAYDYTASNGLSPNDWHYTMYGCTVMNSLNVSVSKHFFMELDINAIFPISDTRVSSEYSTGDMVLPMMQFLLKAGYRF